jgi:hypothetical protein
VTNDSRAASESRHNSSNSSNNNNDDVDDKVAAAKKDDDDDNNNNNNDTTNNGQDAKKSADVLVFVCQLAVQAVQQERHVVEWVEVERPASHAARFAILLRQAAAQQRQIAIEVGVNVCRRLCFGDGTATGDVSGVVA